MSSFTKEQIAVARSCVQLLHTFDVSLGDAAYIYSGSQAAQELLTSTWCDQCGEGVVNFCRSKSNDTCKFGFIKTGKLDVFEQAQKATKLQFSHYNTVMNPVDTKINNKQEAYNEALELAAKICDEYASYSERCDSTLYGGIRSSAAESLAEDIRKQIK